ncbi:outer membrane lipoprotein-sorting protein [Methylomicrobium lacus]|uniref:outer membrane lipoprotein-sorting protein n=1 Tax=Methylomicrobium lacus TaxID=136992 RepID=UPI0035A82079
MTTRHVFAILLCVLSFNALAQTAEERGLEIAREIDRRNEGFVNSLHEADMTLKNRQGEESKRHFILKTLEVSNDGDKDVGLFDNPPDVRGTAVLTYSHGVQPDDQWIFLPSLKRVKRISSVNKTGPFVGSEFAFEDIASWELSKYTYKYLRDEAVDGHDCAVLELHPAYEYSGYTRQVWWVDKAIYQARKIEFYDRKDALLKTLALNDYRQYQDKFWRSHDLLMENLQTGKTTRLVRSAYQFGAALSAQDFTEGALKNIR